MKAALEEFRDRILNDFLPTFCNSRSLSTDGFKVDWSKIAEVDAADFLCGIDGGLATHVDRGLYQASPGRGRDQFFNHGPKEMHPRPLSLRLESIITIAVLARLHFGLGWPKRLLGLETKKGAFDAATYLANDSCVEYIACEVKKTVAELDQLVDLMIRFGNDPSDDYKANKEKNAFKKVQALRCRRPPLFWAVGPGKQNYAFRLSYEEDGVIRFHEVTIEELHYPLGGQVLNEVQPQGVDRDPSIIAIAEDVPSRTAFSRE